MWKRRGMEIQMDQQPYHPPLQIPHCQPHTSNHPSNQQAIIAWPPHIQPDYTMLDRTCTHWGILLTFHTQQRTRLSLQKATTNMKSSTIWMQDTLSTPTSPRYRRSQRIETLLGLEKGIRRLTWFLKASGAYKKWNQDIMMEGSHNGIHRERGMSGTGITGIG